MSDRGSYRAIRTVLIDGPDYQALSSDARLVLLTLKLNLGPAAIDVLYPGVIEAQTGLSSVSVDGALTELEQRDWLRRERNVMWVVEGLRHEPSRSLKNANHLQEIDAHLSALPRLSVVDAFRRHYGIGEPDAPPAPPPTMLANGMGDGMGDGIPKHRVTEEQKTDERKTEDRPTERAGSTRGADAPAAPSLALVKSGGPETLPVSEPAPEVRVTVARAAKRTPGRPGRTHDDVKASIARVFADLQDGTERRLRSDELRQFQAETVFAYWQVTCDKRRALYDADRERLLTKRLTENGGNVDELFYAIDGARRDPYVRDQRGYDLGFMLGTRARVEEYANKCGGYTREEPHPKAANIARALAGESAAQEVSVSA